MVEPEIKIGPEEAVAEDTHVDAGEFVRGTSLWRDAWRRLLKNKLAVFGLIVVILITIASIIGLSLTGSRFSRSAIPRCRNRSVRRESVCSCRDMA